MNERAKIAALVLAAGYSSRMKTSKLLLPIGNSVIIEESVTRFFRAGIGDVRVVVGHRADEIIPVLDRLGAKWVFNEQYDQGMFSSVLAGINSLDPDIRAFFVLPGDIPLVKPRTIRTLVKVYQERPVGIVYPCFQDVRGHPPLISTACLPEDLSWEQPGGLRMLLKQYENEALNVDVADQGILMDCNTSSDYSKLQAYRLRGEILTEEESGIPEPMESLRKIKNSSKETSNLF